MSTTTPQRMTALNRANEVRLGRAYLKRDIAGGRKSAADVVLNPPDCAVTMEVIELLISMRRWGRQRALKLLRPHYIGEMKTLGSLTERQRKLIADALRRAES